MLRNLHLIPGKAQAAGMEAARILKRRAIVQTPTLLWFT